jgi:hypothetical protein
VATDLQILRDTAKKEDDRTARADAWRTIAAIVDDLRGEHWATALGLDICCGEVAEGEAFVVWAARNPGEEIWTEDHGETGVLVTDDGQAVTVWAAVELVDRDEPDWVVVTIPFEEFDGWQPPDVSSLDRRDLALLGELSEAELVDLARSGDPDDVVAAVCSPAATVEVLRAAGAEVHVDSYQGEVSVRGADTEWVTIGHVDLAEGDIADQIRDLIPCSRVVVTTAGVSTIGYVDLVTEDTAAGTTIQDVGFVDLTGDDLDHRDAARDLLIEHKLLGLLCTPNWVWTGYGACYRTLIDVDVEF